ncbi:BTB/POZ and MATH domain-containing protein 1-like [Lolium rigidum]|uniref:BTB/POZ and MATH domain-containing protein 1-like n=1 Tax=Lolium rigidum TaxID=89674 RepID=UPI001F5C7819|nr:BTB/POZ and MATH domain-containing protein 1-like [Lolium rigidum]
MGVRQVTGSHVLRIDGFTQLSKTVANNTEMRSGTFNVGGHDWCLACYPNGCSDLYKGYVSIFLQQASHEKTGAATAKGQLSILDRDGMPSCTKHITERTFKGPPFGWGEIDFVKHEDLDKDKHLHDGCLTVLCDVTVTEHYTHDHVEVAAPAAPPFDLRGQLAEAMWNIKKVDVQIETELSLASTTKLRIDDMDAEVFKALLRFMYTDSPPEMSQLQEAAMAEKILVSADRYKLDKLKLICEKTLCQHIDMSSLAATLALAERHRCSVLTATCIKFLSSPGNLEAFIAADGIKQLKERCPSALLDLAVKN